MADTAYDISLVRGKTVRVTKLDNCGNPVSGSGGQWVGTGFISVKQTKNYDTGNEIKIPNANDVVVVYEKGKKTLLNIDLEIEFAVADTAALALMTGDTVITDAGPLTAGWLEQGLQPLPNYFALEVWSGIANQQCVGTATKYGYRLYPFIENGTVTQGDITNKESNFTIAANTRQGTNWGKGPYDVISSAAAPTVTPAWLPSLLPAATHSVFLVTTVAPPTPNANAGLQTLTPVSS